MSDLSPRLSSREAFVGVTAGLLLALVAWLSSGAPTAFLASHLSPDAAATARSAVPVAAAALPTATATPLPPTDCVAPASTIASVGFDPYAILFQKRPDVLRFYASNGWSPASQCVAIYDNWTKAGAGGKQPTTPAAYVKAQGWAPSAPVPTPAPPADCVAPASEAARLGFDPYRLLALHRPDVLSLYQLNGWNPNTQCVKLFDNWLQHPDGGSATSAAAFVEAKGWAKAPTRTAAPTSTVGATATTVPTASTPSATAAPEATATPSPSASGPPTYTVQPGDSLAAIAQREHVSLAALEQANAITNPNVIQVGQVLRLPASTHTP